MTHKIACLCPTYKRPKCLANAVACFDAQNYSKNLCRLFILDDANQHSTKYIDTNSNIRVSSTARRYSSLPDKFNMLVEISARNGGNWKPDIFVVWEDDDVFLPQHLSLISEAATRGGDYFESETVWSNYQEPMGQIHLEGAAGRFHSSWAFTSELYERVGGYPNTNRLDFDQQLGAKFRDNGKRELYSWNGGPEPTYVYRWGNGIYHGSQQGEDGFAGLWDKIEKYPAPRIGELVPRFDPETALIYKGKSCTGLTV